MKNQQLLRNLTAVGTLACASVAAAQAPAGPAQVAAKLSCLLVLDASQFGEGKNTLVVQAFPGATAGTLNAAITQVEFDDGKSSTDSKSWAVDLNDNGELVAGFVNGFLATGFKVGQVGQEISLNGSMLHKDRTVEVEIKIAGGPGAKNAKAAGSASVKVGEVPLSLPITGICAVHKEYKPATDTFASAPPLAAPMVVTPPAPKPAAPTPSTEKPKTEVKAPDPKAGDQTGKGSKPATPPPAPKDSKDSKDSKDTKDSKDSKATNVPAPGSKNSAGGPPVAPPVENKPKKDGTPVADPKAKEQPKVADNANGAAQPPIKPAEPPKSTPPVEQPKVADNGAGKPAEKPPVVASNNPQKPDENPVEPTEPSETEPAASGKSDGKADVTQRIADTVGGWLSNWLF